MSMWHWSVHTSHCRVGVEEKRHRVLVECLGRCWEAVNDAGAAAEESKFEKAGDVDGFEVDEKVERGAPRCRRDEAAANLSA